MIDLSEIQTEKRTNDWIAWYRLRVIQGTGNSEAEAVGRLILRLKELPGAGIYEPAES